MNASKIGIGILYALPTIGAISVGTTGKYPFGATPSPLNRGESVAASVAAIGGVYAGSHLWKAHPFWGALIGSLAVAFVVSGILVASHGKAAGVKLASAGGGSYDTDEQGV